MKPKNLLLCLSLTLLCNLFALGQGTIFVDGLTRPSAGQTVISSDSWRAAYFRTGANANGYLLNSIQLLMSSPVGNPGGLLVSLRNGGTAPGTNIFDLTGVNPTTDGIYGYSTPSLYLAPLTIYWVVLTAESPSSGGYHRWNIPQALSGPAYDTLDGWQANGYLGSVNGLNWFGERPSPFQYAVVATAVPEPATGVMLIVAVLAILIARSLAKPKSTTHLSSASETGQSGVLTLTGT